MQTCGKPDALINNYGLDRNNALAYAAWFAEQQRACTPASQASKHAILYSGNDYKICFPIVIVCNWDCVGITQLNFAQAFTIKDNFASNMRIIEQQAAVTGILDADRTCQ